jgi:hypothetical protein
MFGGRVRDQWIAPTFESHFGGVAGFGSTMKAGSVP